MMRFIDLGKQIGLTDDWSRQFAFYDTIIDRFVDLAGDQVFDSWKELEESFHAEYPAGDDYLLNRFKGLCDAWVFSS